MKPSYRHTRPSCSVRNVVFLLGGAWLLGGPVALEAVFPASAGGTLASDLLRDCQARVKTPVVLIAVIELPFAFGWPAVALC
jgi:hypothetical protein